MMSIGKIHRLQMLVQLLLACVMVTMAARCPGDRFQCADGHTCCGVDKGLSLYGCCPFQQATCCKDGLHCCPNLYSCNSTTKACTRNANHHHFPSEVHYKTMRIPLKATIPSSSTQQHVGLTNTGTRLDVNATALWSITCPDHVHMCPMGDTCCPMDGQGTSWGCCPFHDAVCCKDNIHCCPHGNHCETSANKCAALLPTTTSRRPPHP